jgi:hypothetical protein
MSLLEQASLVITPNAYKENILYSVVPNTTLGDMNVVRATTATRVNSVGLIESVGVNIPRIDYTNGSCPSILVEPQRTNLLTYSEQFNDASWVKAGVSVTTNTTTAPDGTLTADSVIENSATATQHRMAKFSISLTSGTTYTISAYVKRGVGSRNVQFGGSGTGVWIRVYFDLTNGTVGSQVNGTGTITNVGDGWYKITATGVCDLTGNNTFFLANTNGTTSGSETYNGDGVSSIVWWGAQLEAGANATSYIPTVASTVTRNADVIYKTGISSLIGQTDGTIYAEINFKNASSKIDVNRIIELTDGTNTNRIIIAFGGTNALLTRVTASGVEQASFSASISLGINKIALGYSASGVVLYINGVLMQSNLSATIPATSRINLGYQGTTSASQLNDFINLATIWKTRLTNAELAQLTTL